MPDFVWAHDTIAGRSGPVPAAVAALPGDRYRLDRKHPTRDSRGDLLPWKDSTKKAPRAATETAPKEATK